MMGMNHDVVSGSRSEWQYVEARFILLLAGCRIRGCMEVDMLFFLF